MDVSREERDGEENERAWRDGDWDRRVPAEHPALPSSLPRTGMDQKDPKPSPSRAKAGGELAGLAREEEVSRDRREQRCSSTRVSACFSSQVGADSKPHLLWVTW